MSYSVYLGDIDPNNTIISSLEIRRDFMFQLLMWDSIVISDSQFLTDPRINHLMQEFEDDNLAKIRELGELEQWQKGFEYLINAGLVEVAYRSRNGSKDSITKTWENMADNDTKDVPYLPSKIDFAQYLDGISNIKSRTYDLPSIGGRFKDNLLSGAEDNAIKLDMTNGTDYHLWEMFNQDKVLFRNILDYIRVELQEGRISQERYQQIYDYVYGCYSINISAETGCYVNTRLKHIPFHLESGTGDFEDNLGKQDFSKLRGTWALNPEVLDMIPLDEFVGLRKRMHRHFDDGILMKYYTGVLGPEDWTLFNDFWTDYTQTIEDFMRDCIINMGYRRKAELLERAYRKPEQATIKSGVLELVISGLGCASMVGCDLVIGNALGVVGDVLGVIDLFKASGKLLSSICTSLSKKKSVDPVDQELAALNKYFSPDTRIITKY